MKARAKPAAEYDSGIVTRSRWFPSVEARAQWFFGFLRADLGTLSDEERHDLQRQVIDFVDAVGIDDNTDVTKDARSFPVPTPDALIRMQADARDGWKRLRADQWWMLDNGVRLGIRRHGRRIIGGYRKGAIRDLFIAAAFDVVRLTWDRLYECRRPGCGVVFVKIRQQAYCSQACSQKVRLERFRAKHPRRDYRAERQRATRKRLGANVTPGTRRRR